MAFGRNNNTPTDSETQGGTYISETQSDFDGDDEVQTQQRSTAPEEKDASKPLLEVTIHGAGNSKNEGGSKQWICNHCNGKFTSSYTRIHVHFFGAAPGKTADIRRCPVMVRDQQKRENLKKKVTEAGNSGVAKRLKNLVLSKNLFSRKRIDESFGILERNAVDLKITRGLCANGIPFNVLRNPQFLEMFSAIKNAPDGYKPPSVLLDECVRDVEKELTPVKDTRKGKCND